MKAITVLFPPVRPARLTPRFPLSAAEPTAFPALVASTAADATTPVVAPAASTLNPFIARPGPTSAAATSSDAAKSANSADKPQYVFTCFLNNYLGTTIASSNAAAEIAEIETDAFGAPLARGTLPADMRYTGKPYDEDMGAYIFPFRNYRPDEARWMTPDPSGFPDGPNNRGYATNPTMEIDPNGLDVTVTGTTPNVDQTYTNRFMGGTFTASATTAVPFQSDAYSYLSFTGYSFFPIYGLSYNLNIGGINPGFYTDNRGEWPRELAELAMGVNVDPGLTGTTGNHWIQVVTTNLPANSWNTPNVPFIDNGGDSSNPFYDTHGFANSSYFLDTPTRDLSMFLYPLGHTTFTWSANLYYVTLSGTNSIGVYGGFQYGFSITPPE